MQEAVWSMQGSQEVFVEERAAHGSFGAGRKVQMTFAQFLQKTSAGDGTLYLSTQPVCPTGDALLTLVYSKLGKAFTTVICNRPLD